MSNKIDYHELEVLAQRGRWLAISTVAGSGAGHVGGPFSAMDMLIALYFRVMNIRPEEPRWTERDRFILSKGHSSIGQYVVMALRGFVMLGDGELQEGMVWEALHIAPRYKLGNLTAILDWNGLQQFGWVLAINEQHRGDRRDPWSGIDLRGIFEKLGWRCLEIDGHDFSQIVPALENAKASGASDQPTTGKTHHDVQDLAIMRAMPDMTVVAPADAIEGEAIIRWATDYEGPVYVRLARDASPNVFDEQYRFVPGKTISLKEGGDVLLISTGPQSVRCLQAAELLHGHGISAGVLHVPSIKPVNKEEIVSAAEKAKVVVTVEEHTIYGGLGG